MIKIIKISGRMLFSVAILNITLFVLIFILATAQNFVESASILLIRIPLPLYLTALFLTNLVYLFGITMEILYLWLWNRKIELKEFEQKYFKAGLLMTFLVLAFGILSYLIR